MWKTGLPSFSAHPDEACGIRSCYEVVSICTPYLWSTLQPKVRRT